MNPKRLIINFKTCKSMIVIHTCQCTYSNRSKITLNRGKGIKSSHPDNIQPPSLFKWSLWRARDLEFPIVGVGSKAEGHRSALKTWSPQNPLTRHGLRQSPGGRTWSLRDLRACGLEEVRKEVCQVRHCGLKKN